MSQKTLVIGKVAQVMNERELVINIGARDGVSKGMKFAVLAPTPLIIRDPDTGDELGTVDRPKVRVHATSVREKFTICSTYEIRRTGGYLVAVAQLDNILGPVREEPKTLRASDSSYPPPLDPEESYVQIGDRVIEIEG